MNRMLLVFPLLFPMSAFAFNGEIESPTFVVRFGMPTLAAPAHCGNKGEAHDYNSPVTPQYYYPPNPAPVCVGCHAPQAVQTFLQNSIFTGDSITANWNLKAFFGVPITNQGISGQTSAQILARFPNALSLNPTGVFIMAGMNDAIQQISVSVTERNVATMVSMADTKGAKVFVGTITPTVVSSQAQTFISSYNSWLSGFCNGTNCTRLNYNKAAGGPGFNPSYHINNVHPNNLAYRGMSRMVLHAVSRSIGVPLHHCGHGGHHR